MPMNVNFHGNTRVLSVEGLGDQEMILNCLYQPHKYHSEVWGHLVIKINYYFYSAKMYSNYSK